MLIDRIAVNNNIIVMNRGDTKEVELHLYDDSVDNYEYVMQGNDTIYFGIMDPHQPFENALVKKKYTLENLQFSKSDIVIRIDPEDTLDLIPGKYYYAVKLKIDHDDDFGHIEKVKTIIDKTKFIICD